ncbi:DUF805 domain-containing protein [Telmatobacter sp. DSM 110680]|uniref:DUF805 domain-containing protein n=1 Tax=Telmatobacter sp. DSM 110680 TaxID=3036704 RepID=A0AAU7DKW3_9BACT
MSWFLLAWQRAADFSGRSRRKEYWYFQLFNAIVMIFIGLFAIAFSDQGKPAMIPFGVMFAYGLILVVPSLSVTIRRLHDIGKSGWWYFIAFIPLIGGIILFVFTLFDSEPYANQWGLDPKASERAIVPPYAMPR